MPEPAPASTRSSPPLALLLILGSLSAFGPLCIDMYLPGLPDLRSDLSAGESVIGLTLTGCLAGLALGQLVAGPISDARGRRSIVLIGLVAFIAASIGCALAPSAWVLAGLRLVQGFSGAAGIVVARAMVRDQYEGTQAAHVFSLLLLVNGAAPILAPILGGQILRFTSWRGVFLVLTGIGVLLLVVCWIRLPETLAPAARRTGGLRETRAAFGRLARDRGFGGHALACGLAFAAMFAYISGSPFVLQDVYGVSKQGFSLLFALNALGIVTAGRLSALLLARGVSPARLLGIGLVVQPLGGLALLVCVSVRATGLVGVAASLFVVVACIGIVLPNATALALADHPRDAGSAAGLLGVFQFALGAAAAPLVGVAGARTAIPMGVVVCALTLLAPLALRLLTRARPAVARASG